MTERLVRDIHPAEVYWPEKSTTPVPARVFVTTERVQVYIELDDEVALLSEAVLPEPPDADRGSLFGQLHLATDEGVVHVSKGRGCGCHSALKALSPPVTW